MLSAPASDGFSQTVSRIGTRVSRYACWGAPWQRFARLRIHRAEFVAWTIKPGECNPWVSAAT